MRDLSFTRNPKLLLLVLIGLFLLPIGFAQEILVSVNINQSLYNPDENVTVSGQVLYSNGTPVANNPISVWIDGEIAGRYVPALGNVWRYYKLITINNTANPDNLTDYQVLVTLDTQSLISEGEMQPDCGDIRFTWFNETSQEEQEIPYWIESGCNTSSTKIWIKVPYIPANGNATIYAYYGNHYVTSKSNGSETFLLFDLRFDGPIGGRSSYSKRHSCALLSNGSVKCWGYNGYGELGDGTTTNRYTPVTVLNLSDAVSIAVGGDHTCALLSNGIVKCWGKNYYGQLGDDTATNRYTPVTVLNLSDAISIAAGEAYTCALLSNGSVKCWGYNSVGQLGDNTTTNRYTPVTVSGIDNAIGVATGMYHSCALLSNGSVKCWGDNRYGQLGDGTTTNRYIPGTVLNLSDAVSIAAGAYHTCALLSNGSVKCWGRNGYGQLGDGTTTNRYTPGTVLNLSDAVSIAAGAYHTCALLSNGTIKCWGYNAGGQLGDNTTTNRYTPVTVLNLSNAVSIAVGASRTCALLSNGTAKCWGYNSHGELGDGTTTNRYTPVTVLNYNFGGRYDKTGGIPSTVQRPPYFNDTYFVRKYASVEPTTSVGTEEVLISSTNFNGNYTLTFPAPLESGLHLVKVNLTDSNSVYGENETSFVVDKIALREQKAVFQQSGTNYLPLSADSNLLLNISVKVYRNLDNPVDKIWIDITLPNGTVKTYYLDNTSSRNETQYWYKILNVSEEFNTLVGQYVVTFYANSTLSNGSVIIQELPAPTAEFYIQNISISIDTEVDIINPGRNIVVSGHAELLPYETNVSNNRISIWLDGELVRGLYIPALGGLWEYKKAITIDNTGNSDDLTGYPVLVTLNTQYLIFRGMMQPDCDDIRFTWFNETSQEEQEIPYWIESGCNTSSTKIWVKVPKISSSSTETIYIYYGNPDATSESNGDKVFLSFGLSDSPLGARSSSYPYYHSCALLSNGTIKCWGYNGYGQLGDNTTTNRYTPVTVSGIDNAIGVATGMYHSCALLSNGSVKCWGYNGYGQLGDGTTTDRHTPVTVQDIDDAVSIAAGYYHTCALLSNGIVKCWGANGYGQLGIGGTSSVTTPKTVGLSNVVSIAAGTYHTCAVLSDGTAKCWGYNSQGQLGNGGTNTAYAPVTVSGLSNAVSIAAGNYHTCALLSDGSVKCWGDNDNGQLGDTTTTDRLTPTSVYSLGTAVSITAGNDYSCAVISDGTAKCWGYNNYGQLGDGTTTRRTTPVRVSNLVNVISIAAGYYHTCAFFLDGSMKCWGRNNYGQLGDGTTTESHTPVTVLNYNFGARYDKTGGIHSVQKAPYFSDIYFLRESTSPEPSTTIITESEEHFLTSTDSTGDYNYTLVSPLEAGRHTIKVSLTEADGTSGENETSFDVYINLMNPQAISMDTRHNVGNPGDTINLLVEIPTWNIDFPDVNLSQVWAEVTKPDNQVEKVDLTGSPKGGVWSGTFSNTQELGVYTVVYYANLSTGFNKVTVTSTTFEIQKVSPSVNTNKLFYNPGEDITVSGASTLQLSGSSVVDRPVSIWVDGTFIGENTSTLDALGKYKRLITIDNTDNPNNLTDYQILVVLDTQGLISKGKMQPDCDDIRFTWFNETSHEEQEIPYWIESGCNTGSTQIWVKVPKISSSSTETIYIYYGNPDATSESNGDETFLLFDLGFDGPLGGRNSFSGNYQCALLSDGTAKCWGDNSGGQLGDGTSASSRTPVSVLDLSDAVAISTGLRHTCALLADGSVKCWGYNGYGQLGDGTTTESHSPVTVLNLSDAISVAGGYYHTCALLSNGTAKCWGYNAHGELGDGTTTNRYMPVTVSGLSDAISVAGGYYHTCALLSNGTAKCWGYNAHGELGDGTTTNRYMPVTVSGLSDVVAIAAGAYHTCALLSNGTIKCWGNNGYGQLGDNTTTSSSTPVTVLNLSDAISIAVGAHHSCALLSNSSVKCWGYNGYGQLGDGTKNNRYTPVTVHGIDDAVAIAAGYYHTCALLSNGTTKCWGDNDYGQLGDDTITDSSTPVTVHNYNFGGRYDKTGGIHSVQKAPYFNDTYFVRKYASPEPTIIVGTTVFTDSSGNYNYTFPAPLEAGEHTIKVNLTDSNGIYGEDETTFTVNRIAIREQKSVFLQTGNSHLDIDDLDSSDKINISAKVYRNLDNPIDKVWIDITLPNGTVKTYYLDNTSARNETQYWYKILNVSQEFNNTLGVYNVSFYANSTLANGSTITQELPAPETSFYIEDVLITVKTDKSTYSAGSNVTVSGVATLQPSGDPIANNSILISVDGEVIAKYAPAYNGTQNGNWKNYKLITINNTANPDNLTDYQVLVTLDTQSLISEGEMQPDCDDIRFTWFNETSQEEQEIPYWIESGCNTSSTKIWVKVPYIPANGNATIYAYYGNPDAVSESNGSETFLLFDLKFDGPIGGRSSGYPYYHSCALLSNGTAKCWGDNGYGQLGDGTTTDSSTPVTVSGITNAVAIAVGYARTCVVLSNGTAKCWGYNSVGQLGDGTTTSSSTPVTVSGITNAVAIAAGNYHTCVLLSDGSVKCWGDNDNGQLGDGTTTSSSTPVTVSGITNAVAIAVGAYHTCALLSDGSVKCWGGNGNGQLGDGTTTSSSTPVTVSGITNAVSIDVGNYHTCALLIDGTVKCWGKNGNGQLGDGTTTERHSPVTVSGITNAIAISAGYEYSCAVISDGTAKCWGYNSVGQLGDGTTTSSSTPVTVLGLSDAVAISAGYYHTCALLSNGSMKCWGGNGYGQLGDGTTTDSSTPVTVHNYNFGGRYDKTGGIHSVQKAPYFNDTYFVRKYASVEPTTSVGTEEVLTIFSTDSNGAYNYTFFTPLTVGAHTIKVNLTDSNGIYGENTTTFNVCTLTFSELLLSDSHNQRDSILNPNESYNITVKIQEFNGSSYFPVTSGSFNLTVGGNTYALIHTGDSVWHTNETFASPSALGTYSFLVNISGVSGNGISGSVEQANYTYYVKKVSISLNLNDTVVNPEDAIQVSGDALLLPDNSNITNITVNILVDGVLLSNTTTDSNGHFNYTFTAPLEAGIHTIKVNLTDSNGIYGENETTFANRIAIREQKALSPQTLTSHLNQNQEINISALVYKNIDNQIDRVWVKITLPNGTVKTYYLDNTSARNETQYWYKILNVSQEFNNLMGQYTVAFYANSTLSNGSVITQELPPPTAEFYIQSILISVLTDSLTYNPGDPIFITGTVTLQPSGIPVSDTIVYIYADSLLNDSVVTDSNGTYNYTLHTPLEAGTHTIKVNLTDSNGIYGENETIFANRIAIREQKAVSPQTLTSHLNQNQEINISALVYKNIDNQIDRVWVKITLPNGTVKTYYLDNTSARNETQYWYKILNVSQEFNNLMGQYTVAFYANSTLSNGSTITQLLPTTYTVFDIQNIAVSINTNKLIYKPGENVTINGTAILIPDDNPVANNHVSFLLDGSLHAGSKLQNWKYWKPITISEQSGNDLTDFQIPINITYDTGMQSDFDDIRFSYYNASNNSEIEIPYWIETKVNESWAYVWVKVPYIPANKNTTISLYYGNDEAKSASDGLSLEIFQLREYDIYSNYNPNFIFTKPEASVLRIDSYTGGSAPYGVGYAFIHAKKDYLHGKKLRIKWKVYYSYPEVKTIGSLIIVDHPHLRTKTREEFKENDNIDHALADYNNIMLLTKTSSGSVGWTSWSIDTSSVINLSSFTSEDVTILIREGDAWPQTLILDIDYLQILDSSDNVLKTINFTDSIVMEQTGTYRDYGLYRKYVSPEPTVIIGEKQLVLSTDSSGHFNYTFTAPLEAGTHTIKVHLTDSNGIYGENETDFHIAQIISNLSHYPALVHRGDTISLSSWSLGNSSNPVTLHDVWLNYSLPSGWSIVSQSNFLGDLSPGEQKWNNATVKILNSDLGPQLINLTSLSGEGIVSKDSRLIEVWGWSDVNFVSPQGVVNRSDHLVNLSCSVVDNLTLAGISNYSVRFFVDGVNLVNLTTDSDGYAIYTWDTTSYSPGDHSVSCIINDNSTLYYNASVSNSSVTLTLYGDLIVSINKSEDYIYKNDTFTPYNSTITATVTDEFGNVIQGALVEFRVGGSIIGVKSTDIQGKASVVYNPPDTSGIHNYTISITATKDLYNPGYGADWIIVQGFLFSSIDSPVNGSILNRGLDYWLNGSVWDDSGVSYNLGSWYLNDTLLSTTQDYFWSIPSDQVLGDYLLRFNASAPFSSPTARNISIRIFGLSKLSSISPRDMIYYPGTVVEVKCSVIDANTSQGLVNYPVRFYKNGVLQAINLTDGTGYAFWHWNTSGDYGLYEIRCEIDDNETLLYNSSDDWYKESSIEINDTLYINQTIFSDREIYRKDSYAPYFSTISVQVLEPSVNGILEPSVNSTVSFYFADQELTCLTGVDGFCSVVYNSDDLLSPGNYSILINSSKPCFTASSTLDEWIIVKGKLFGWISTPGSGAKVHKGDNVTLEAEIYDEYDTPLDAFVEWNTSSGTVSEGKSSWWVIPSNFVVGPETLQVFITKPYYDSISHQIGLEILGWSNPVITSPSPGSYNYGSTLDLSCEVVDSNSSQLLVNYPVQLWVNSTLVNSSTGRVSYSWQIPAEIGIFEVWCNITDNSTLYYTSSSQKDSVLITSVDGLSPVIDNVTLYPSPPLIGQDVNLSWSAWDAISLDSTWVRVGYPNGTVSEVSGTSCSDNCYFVMIYDLEEGVYNYTIYANDTSGNLVETFNTFSPTIGAAVSLDPASTAVDGITQESSQSFVLQVTLSNVGNEVLNFANLSLTFYNPSYFSSNSTFESCGNISVGSNCTRYFNITVKEKTPPLTSWIVVKGEWQRPDLSLAEVSNVTEVVVLENPVLRVSPLTLSNTVSHGSSKIIGNLNLSSIGNYRVEGLELSSSNSSLPSDWLEFTPVSFTHIEPGSSHLSKITVSVPLGQSPADYSTTVWINTSNANNLSVNLTVTVPSDKSWSRVPEVITRTIVTNSTGSLGILNLTNLGNVDFGLDIGKEGNVSDYLCVEGEGTTVSISKQSSKPLLVSWLKIPQTGFYAGNITMTNLLAAPHQLKTAIQFEVIEFTVDILYPNSSSPLLTNASSLINVGVRPSLAGEVDPNVNFSIFIDDELCVLNKSDWVGYFINLTCLTPSLPDARVYDLTVQSYEESYNAYVNSTEFDAIVYDDITPPTIHWLIVNDTDVNSSTLIKANITDNSLSGLKEVSLHIVYPNGALQTYSMENTSPDIWQFNFTDTSQEGDYNITLYATDSSDNLASMTKVFRVSYPTQFSIKVSNEGSDSSEVQFVFYSPKTEKKVYNFTSNESSVDHNTTVYAGLYDLEVKALSHTLQFEKVNLTKNASRSSLILEEVPTSFVPLSLTRVTVEALAIETGLTYENLSISLNFSDSLDAIRNISNLRVYRCKDWLLDERVCNGTWENLGGEIDKKRYLITVYTNSTSIYVVAESVVCGNGICEEEYGENSNNCAEDCPVSSSSSTTTVSSTTLTKVYNETSVIVYNNTIYSNISSNQTSSSSLSIEDTIKRILDELQKSSKEPVEVKEKTITLELFQGETLQRIIPVKNNMNHSAVFEISSNGDISDFISFVNPKIKLSSGNEGSFKIVIQIGSDVDAGLYTGFLIITCEDKIIEVPVNLRVLSTKNELLDVSLTPLRDEISPGSSVPLEVTLYNLGKSIKTDVDLTLEIFDIDEGEVLTSIQQVLAVYTSLSRIFYLKIPEDIKEGKYQVRAIAKFSYFNRTVAGQSFAYIKVRTPFLVRKFYGLLVWQWLVICVGGLIFVLLGIFVYKRHKQKMKKKRRYLELVDLRSLPLATPDSAFVGNLAETGTRAWVYLKDLTTHAMVSGATGSGKTISAMVLAEEALLHERSVIVFDPTAQWTGFLRKCKESDMLKQYKFFGLRKEEAKAFKGRIKVIESPLEKIDLSEIILSKEPQIVIFCLTKLKSEDMDIFVANTINQIFKSRLPESRTLRSLIIYDEVHRLLPKFGGRGKGFLALERGVREFRKWGLGLLLISQVTSDFVGELKANIGMEIQLRTRYEEDLDRISRKYGKDIEASVVKAAVGTGMFVFSEYNRGRPYFITFRPILHQVSRLSDKELDAYVKYDQKLEELKFLLNFLKSHDIDVFYLETEFRLCESKLMEGSFDVIDIFLESLEPRIKDEFKKHGLKIPKYKKELVKEKELERSVKRAKQEREKFLRKVKGSLSISSLESQVNRIKKLIKQAKSKGKDVFLQELDLERIPPQLRVLKVTKDREGLEDIAFKLNKIEEDVKKILRKKRSNREGRRKRL